MVVYNNYSSIGWDQMSACKGTPGCHYQFPQHFSFSQTSTRVSITRETWHTFSVSSWSLCMSGQWLIHLELIPVTFKHRATVLKSHKATPPDGMVHVVHHRVTPSIKFTAPIYKPGWRETLWVKFWISVLPENSNTNTVILTWSQVRQHATMKPLCFALKP